MVQVKKQMLDTYYFVLSEKLNDITTDILLGDK